MTTLVYRFDSGTTDPAVLGGKGASLARMAALGMPVPPGFTVTTAAWRARRDGTTTEHELRDCIDQALRDLEGVMERRLGDPEAPLLLSVRSGAAVSMPGMMDTILNVGLTEDVLAALEADGDGRFAPDLYIRLLESFAEIVRGIDRAALDELRASRGADASAWRALIAEHGAPFPDDPHDQLFEAVQAVWRSWDSPRARRYRRYRGIAEDLGTAVTVQAMVFGNRDARSGTGVVFTRDPATGEPGAYGDFLPGAQGDDVVSGEVTPLPLASAAGTIPAALEELTRCLPSLERAWGDMCDVEFTVESGELFILQARVGQRSGAAAVRIVADLVDEGVIDVAEGLRRIPAAALQELRTPVRVIDDRPALGTGVPASPGTAIGEIALSSGCAERRGDEGADVILIRPGTSPHDVAGMIASRGVVTALGGRASHAAVVARGIGRPAVCGIDGLVVDEDDGLARFPGGEVLREGDTITVDGTTGAVFRGDSPVQVPPPAAPVTRILQWCRARLAVPVLDDLPDGLTVVRGPEDVEPGLSSVVLDIEWEGAASHKVLEATCDALRAVECPEWSLLIPPDLRGADLQPPAGPWCAVAAPGPSAWAGLLVAARLQTTEPAVSAGRTGRPAAASAGGAR